MGSFIAGGIAGIDKMKNKIKQEEKNYFLKGGKIGAIIGVSGVILTLLLTSFGYIMNNQPFNLILIPFIALSFLFVANGVLGCNFKSEQCFSEMILGDIITIIIFFVVGALIGWIYGKIKRRNER